MKFTPIQHTAVETAFLIRKLKVRIGLQPGRLNCVGTSASLDASAGSTLIKFATDLFGENFRIPVITGKREVHEALQTPRAEWSLDAPAWARLAEELSAVRDLQASDNADWTSLLDLSEAGPFAGLDRTLPLHRSLFERFAANKEVRTAARLLEGKSRLTADVAAALFPGVERPLADAALAGVIAVGVVAKPGVEDFALSSATSPFGNGHRWHERSARCG